MRIAAMGDIHSNHIALEECMRWVYMNNIDGIAFLGDYVSDCPYPQKTLRIIRNIPEAFMTWFVRGNREDYMLDHRYNLTENWHNSSQSGSLFYTYNELTGGDMRFFEDMPIGMEVKIDGYPPFSICHGSMQSNRDLFYEGDELMYKVMDEMTTSLLVCGHCHVPYKHTRRSKTIINAGSVGNPVNGDTKATLVLLESDGGNWTAEHVSVPFDTEKVIEEFYQSGLIYTADVWARCFVAALREGRNYNHDCVKIVRRLAEERGLEFSDEELWQEAAKQLEV